MSEKVIITESKLTAIGDKIRSRLGSESLYTLDNMPSAIDDVGFYTKGKSCLDYLKYGFSLYVDSYVAENGLYINGVSTTRSALEDYLLNRDNCKYRGKLSKYGKYIVGEDGAPVEIRGIGTHHLIQYGNLHTKECLETLKYLGINCIRMSAYLNTHTFTYSDGLSAVGYLADPTAIKAEMDRIIEYCVDLGLYVIVDWHVWSGGGETLNTSSAVEFFTYFAQKYHDCDNILYELANEPFRDTLADIVSHCITLRTLIRSYVEDPILITGLRSFTNGINEMKNALAAEGITDIFLSQHRYTGGAALSTFEGWWEDDVPLFITEWSNTSASTGTQSDMNITDGNAFLNFFHDECIPHCIWKFTDQTMAYAVLQSRGSINNEYYKFGGFLENELSGYGRYMFGKLSSFAFENHIDRQGVVPGSITYSVTKTIQHATESNSATVVNEQSSYTNIITPDTNYKLFGATVTMGGVDITSTAVTVNNDVYTISIASVTGNITISTNAMVAWESGTITAKGTDSENTARIRTKTFIPADISQLTCPVGLEFTPVCYNENGDTWSNDHAIYYDFDSGTFLTSGKWFGQGTYDLSGIRNSNLPQIRLIARNLINDTNISATDGEYFFTGGSPYTEVTTNWVNGAHTFSNGVTLDLTDKHVTLDFPALSSNVYFVNISSPASNTSDMTSNNNINNLSDSFVNILAGDIVSVRIKNIETTCVNNGTGIQTNIREQNSATSIMSSPVTSSISGGAFPDAIGGEMIQAGKTASCAFVYLNRYFSNGRLEFDIDVKVVRRTT